MYMSNLIISNSIELYTRDNPDEKKKKKRVIGKAGQNFEILKISDFNKLIENEYRVNQLKDMCRHYKLKVSGNKKCLIARIYSFLKLSYYSIKIQNRWRKYLYRKFIYNLGPAFKNRSICVNETDFFTMDDLTSVPTVQFFSYKDVDNTVYGFDIKSIYNLLSKEKNNAKNPYNRKPFPKQIKKNINEVIKLSVMLNLDLNINIQSDNLSREKYTELKIIGLFQDIDALGNYTNAEWFLSLTKIHLIRYIRELLNIWTYRANLDFITKREICPPIGNPFMGIYINMLPNKNIEELREISQSIIERMVKTGVNHGSKCLGASYVLCALTLVNSEAAQALPWLYESVAPN